MVKFLSVILIDEIKAQKSDLTSLFLIDKF